MLVHDFNFLANNNYVVPPIPPGNYGAMMIRIAGTNSTGTPITRNDLGRIELSLGNVEMDRIDLDKLWGMTDKLYPMDYGKQQFSSTGNGALIAEFIRPFHLPKDVHNCLSIGQNELTIRFVHNSLSSLASAIQAYVYLIPRLGWNRYFLRLRNFTQVSKSQNSAPDSFNFTNVGLLHLDYSASLTQFIFTKDNKDLVNAPDLATLQLYRPFQMPRSDAYADADSNFNGFDFNFAKGGLETALGSKYAILMAAASAINFTGAVGTIHPNKNAELRSMHNYNSRIAINAASE